MNSGQDHEQCLLILTLENVYCWSSMHLAENEVSLTAIVTWVTEKKVMLTSASLLSPDPQGPITFEWQAITGQVSLGGWDPQGLFTWQIRNVTERCYLLKHGQRTDQRCHGYP